MTKERKYSLLEKQYEMLEAFERAHHGMHKTRTT
jgi:hypothetical protein